MKLHELREFLGRHLTMTRRDEPDWILELSHERIDPGMQPGADAAQLVVQQDRRAGTDLLTRRDRHRSLGAAAEADATLLRSAEGLVGVDPVSVGISVGWRFR